MAKVTGIGGIFIKTYQDQERLKGFYKDKLGLLLSEYGVSIISDTSLTLLTIEKGSNPYPFLNFTVDNLDEMITDLRAKGVNVVKGVEEFDYGKFATIKDDNGNLIELWEPYRKQYLEMVEKEINQKDKKE